MPADKGRYVVKNGDRWAVRAGGASRASSVHDTQRQAEKTAKGTVMIWVGRGPHPGP